MIKFKEIRLYPSDWYLHVIIGTDEKTLGEFCHRQYGDSKEYYIKELLDGTIGYVNHWSTTNKSKSNGHARIVLFMRQFNKGHLVHELIHVLWRSHHCIGFNMKYESQEWQASFFEYLYVECCKNDYKIIK